MTSVFPELELPQHPNTPRNDQTTDTNELDGEISAFFLVPPCSRKIMDNPSAGGCYLFPTVGRYAAVLIPRERSPSLCAKGKKSPTNLSITTPMNARYRSQKNV